MKRMAILGGLMVAACVPAIVGLVGNASFGDSVPVRVPESAVLTTGTLDDRGGFTTLDDDVSVTLDAQPATTGTTTTSATPTATASTSATTTTTSTGASVDDHGGSRKVEPGDDHGLSRQVEPGDDHGGRRGSGTGDDQGGRDSGRDFDARGSDDSGSDDSGSGDSGSDDSDSSGRADRSGRGGGDDGSGHR